MKHSPIATITWTRSWNRGERCVRREHPRQEVDLKAQWRLRAAWISRRRLTATQPQARSN